MSTSPPYAYAQTAEAQNRMLAEKWRTEPPRCPAEQEEIVEEEGA